MMRPEEQRNDGSEPRTINGHPLVDMYFENVGKITDVLFDNTEMVPSWAVVRTGLFSGEHYVPLEHAYLDEEGRIVVPIDKKAIKKAPKARNDHVISGELAKELSEYYGIAA